jgi:ribonuclease HI
MRAQDLADSKKKYYAIARGRETGIFSTWFGIGNAEQQVRGFAGARYKGFPTIDEARSWMKEQQSAPANKQPAGKKRSTAKPKQPTPKISTDQADVIIYTDGGCSHNPGPGGYGAVLLAGGKRNELSGRFKHTTNNRMELMACIMALKSVKPGLSVLLHSDSQYVVNGISKGWAAKWQAQGWMRNKKDAAENYDLWQELLEACEPLKAHFVWVKGHAGNEENERCDELATQAMTDSKPASDKNFETGRTTITA